MLQSTWTSAARAWGLLNGIQLGAESIHLTHYPGYERHKRHADDAFGVEKSSDYPQRGAFGGVQPDAPTKGENGVHDFGCRIMAHMLGLGIPGVETPTTYYPGYEWWARPNQVVEQQHLPPMQSSGIQNGTDSLSMASNTEGGNAGWATADNTGSTMNFGYDFARFGA